MPNSFTGEYPVYKYTMEEGRDRAWEEDIVYFMFRLQKYHPMLLESPEMNYEFQVRIENLIKKIPDLKDYEIAYGLSEIAASFNDSHTIIDLLGASIDRKRFPIGFHWFYEDGIYARVVHKNNEEAFLRKLVSVNGVDIEEIFQRMAKIVSHENMYYLKAESANNLRILSLLRYINLMGDEETADFTFIDGEGKTFTVNLALIEVTKPEDVLSVDFPPARTDSYWSEFFPGENTLYVCHRKCAGDTEGTIAQDQFYQDVLKQVQELGAEKLIIDVRYNSGGYMDFDSFDSFAQNLSKTFKGKLFVLINEGTFSGGVFIASRLKYFNKNAVLVGQPTGEPPTIYGGVLDALPNSGIRFSHAVGELLDNLPGYKANSLLPDIYIPLTVRDYIDNYDRVLETVRGF